jgi:phage-related protein
MQNYPPRRHDRDHKHHGRFHQFGRPRAHTDEIGTALSVAQFGGKHPSAKPWKGEGPGIFEVAEDHRGDAYRAVYTVRFEGVVYVLHAFQKKSPSGIRTSKKDVDLIVRRLNEARMDFEVRYGTGAF